MGSCNSLFVSGNCYWVNWKSNWMHVCPLRIIVTVTIYILKLLFLAFGYRSSPTEGLPRAYWTPSILLASISPRIHGHFTEPSTTPPDSQVSKLFFSYLFHPFPSFTSYLSRVFVENVRSSSVRKWNEGNRNSWSISVPFFPSPSQNMGISIKSSRFLCPRSPSPPLLPPLPPHPLLSGIIVPKTCVSPRHWAMSPWLSSWWHGIRGCRCGIRLSFGGRDRRFMIILRRSSIRMWFSTLCFCCVFHDANLARFTLLLCLSHFYLCDAVLSDPNCLASHYTQKDPIDTDSNTLSSCSEKI